eukprot:TRINITY_DN7624_c0_g1_i1.p2 TRINITY_DN7624_c0_g1~~TRINITY_DN7624_c0_g1_i1.p2  ORF type:complete len:125 (-),score=24.90 TRINITY_DN7624_c0_g1_i1:1534-1908(-)
MMLASSSAAPSGGMAPGLECAGTPSSSSSEFHLMVEHSQDEPSVKPAASFWSSSISAISKVAGNVEGRLAEWFGLNQSKFQWAVDSYLQERAVAAERKRLQNQGAGSQMSASRVQVMQRDGLPV